MAQLKDLLVSGAARFLNGLNINGDLTVAGNLLPAKNETYNLGDSNHRWLQTQTKYLSVGAGDISSTGYEAVISGDLHTTGYSLFDDYVQIGGARDNTAYKFYVNGKTHLKGDTRIHGDLLMTASNSSIYWDNETYRQRILTTDDSTADTAVFTFQQSSDKGSNWSTLLTIRDNGKLIVPHDIIANKSIRNLEIGGGIYWNPYVESTTDASDVASITVIKAGCAGGTELRISQMNDTSDVINLVTNKYIYLNGKKAFSIQDSWLRINDEKGFSSGIYTGASLVRTDSQFQVGNNGANFYANSSGNGYFSNTLGIAGTNTSYKLYVNGTSRFNNTLYFFNSTGDTALSIESRRSKNSNNENIETNTGLATKDKSFIEIRGFAPPTMVRTTKDRPAPYGLGFYNNGESAGIMPIGENDKLQELMFYGANSGPTLFTWKHQIWEAQKYDTDSSNGYSAAMMSLNSMTGDLYVKNTVGINGQNTGYKLYVNGTSYFNGTITAKNNMYEDTYNSGALNMNNSNICGINSLYWADTSNGGSEGIHFYRDATHVDTLWMNGGVMYFVPNRALGTNTSASNSNVVIHSGNYNSYAPSKTGSGASGTWGISISGNASTATAIKDRQTGTAIYLNYGASSLTSASLLAAWNGYELRTISPKAVQDLVQHSRQVTVDLSSLDNSKWFPVTGSDLPRFGYNKIKVSVQLNSGTTPSWSTHAAGFTVNVELYTTQSGWGTTGSETIVLNDSYSFATVHPVGYSQNSYSSTPVLWLRGGGKYYVETDFEVTWTVRTSLYYTYNSPPYTQTVEPTTSYPGIQGVNGTIKAGAVYGAVWNDYAEYRESDITQPGRCIIENGDDTLKLSTERLQRGAEIVSDTFGFAIGETDTCKTPIAASGRVLAYGYENREQFKSHIGYPVCSGPNGTVSIMTDEEEQLYPSRIIGYISAVPDYEIWGTGNVKVDGRIWIRIK